MLSLWTFYWGFQGGLETMSKQTTGNDKGQYNLEMQKYIISNKCKMKTAWGTKKQKQSIHLENH